MREVVEGVETTPPQMEEMEEMPVAQVVLEEVPTATLLSALVEQQDQALPLVKVELVGIQLIPVLGPVALELVGTMEHQACPVFSWGLVVAEVVVTIMALLLDKMEEMVVES